MYHIELQEIWEELCSFTKIEIIYVFINKNDIWRDNFRICLHMIFGGERTMGNNLYLHQNIVILWLRFSISLTMFTSKCRGWILEDIFIFKLKENFHFDITNRFYW